MDGTGSNCRGAHCASVVIRGASVVIRNNQNQMDMVGHDDIFVDQYGFIDIWDVLYRLFNDLTYPMIATDAQCAPLRVFMPICV